MSFPSDFHLKCHLNAEIVPSKIGYCAVAYISLNFRQYLK